MELESQVCSLEYSKRLKALGIKQDSLFYWILFQDWSCILYGKFTQEYYRDCVSAFTVAELGEMLPNEVTKHNKFFLDDIYFLRIEKSDSLWVLKYTDEEYLRENILLETRDENEANGRAKMLIYLIENNLYKIGGEN